LLAGIAALLTGDGAVAVHIQARKAAKRTLAELLLRDEALSTEEALAFTRPPGLAFGTAFLPLGTLSHALLDPCAPFRSQVGQALGPTRIALLAKLGAALLRFLAGQATVAIDVETRKTLIRPLHGLIARDRS
jgi:hypothetical protein